MSQGPGKTAVRPFDWRDKVGYAAGDFGCNMSCAIITSYMLLFYVNVLGINPLHYAAIIAVIKILDAFDDPIVGALVDASRGGKRGKFKPWILWSSIPLVFVGALVFLNVPNAPYGVKIALCFVTYLAWDIAYTCMNIPYGSMASVITANPVQRTQLSNFRSVGALLANIPVMILVPLLLFKDNNPVGSRFFPLALVLGVISFGAFMLTYFWCEERIKPQNKEKVKFNYLQTVKSILKNRPMVGMIVCMLFFKLFCFSGNSTNQYVFMSYFKDTKLLSLSNLATMLPMILGMFVVTPLTKRFGKKALCSWPFLGSFVVDLMMAFAPISNPYVWIVLQALSGAFMGFFSLLMWALIADCIDYQEMITGRREEGTVYATYNFLSKFVSSFSASIIAVGLSMTGYVAELQSNQPIEVAKNLKTMSGLLPAIGCLFCFLAMQFIYNLDKEGVADMNKALGRSEDGSLEVPELGDLLDGND